MSVPGRSNSMNNPRQGQSAPKAPFNKAASMAGTGQFSGGRGGGGAKASGGGRASGQSKSGPLYHYTDRAGVEGIASSGVIQKSNGFGDAAYGEGVYLTKIPPHRSTNYILNNNYDDGMVAQAGRSGNADYYVKVHPGSLPVTQVASKDTHGRDIHLLPGQDLDLSQTKHTIGQRK